MKVTDMVTTPLSVPIPWPFISGNMADRANPVVVQLFTDERLEGIGLAFTWNDRRVKSLTVKLRRLEEREAAGQASAPPDQRQ